VKKEIILIPLLGFWLYPTSTTDFFELT